MSFEEMMAKGRNSLMQRQYNDALSSFKAAASIDPSNVHAVLSYLQASLSMGNVSTILSDGLRALSLAPDINYQLKAKYYIMIGYFLASNEASAFTCLKEIVEEIERFRQNPRSFFFDFNYMLSPPANVLNAPQRAIVTSLLFFLNGYGSSSILRYISETKGYWPGAWSRKHFNPVLVQPGSQSPIPLDKLDSFIMFTDSNEVHECSISGVYLRSPPARRRYRHGTPQLYPSDEKGQKKIEIEGVTLHSWFSQSIHPSIMTPVNRFRKMTLLVRERGKIVQGDKNKVALEWLMPPPGKTAVIKDSKVIVPACKHCDGPLLSRSDLVNDDEWSLSTCPYCSASLEVKWRNGKAILVEFDTNPANWTMFQSSSQQQFFRNKTYTMPVIYKGTIRPLEYTDKVMNEFIAAFMEALPGNALGPVTIVLQHSRQNGYAFVKAVLPDTTSVPVITAQEFTAASPDQVLTKIEHDAEKKAKLIERAQKQATQAQKRKEREEKRERQRRMQEIRAAPDVNIDTLIRLGVPFDTGKPLSNTYLHIEGSDRDMNWAAFKSTIRRGNGDLIPAVPVDPGRRKNLAMNLDTAVIESDGLSVLMALIQKSAKEYFSSVKFFTIESTVQYQDGLVHQYLKPVLNEPGQPTKVPKGGRLVQACASCDAMLLRFSFNWVFQNDDFKLHDCPYCKAPLKIIERKPKLVPVFLDPDATGCIVTGTNNQIGVIYNNVVVKLTVKVKAMLHFLQNYARLFPNNVIGPLDVRFQIKPRSKALSIQDVKFSKFERGIEWRPVVLYPEDLIAF